jgi:hypothetical protein
LIVTRIFGMVLIVTSILLASQYALLPTIALASMNMSGVDNMTMTDQIGPQVNVTDFLFVQHALSGSAKPVQDGSFVLTFNNTSKTIIFSERPERVVSVIPDEAFNDMWSSGKDRFASDPPNAALVIESDGTEDIAIVELLNSTYNADAKTFQYEVSTLSNTSTGIPAQFDRVTMVVDGGDVESKVDPGLVFKCIILSAYCPILICRELGEC